ncbi:hypothetical protein JCM11641_001399, partial [Rhodosporidiobolus odoratus]
MPGKTRTSTSHGPAQNKKQFKHDKRSTPSTSRPTTASSAKPTSHPTSAATEDAPYRKRKATEDEPDKVVLGAQSSLLNQPEEIDFPRGGGSQLTQKEVREAQLEGENEADQVGPAFLPTQEAFIPERRLLRQQAMSEGR